MKKIYLIILVTIFIPSITFGATFNRNLSYGMTGTDVSQLQQFLTDEGLYNGPITDYFGPLTQKAVIAFQEQQGITPALGYVGNLTKTAIASISSANPSWLTTPSNNNSYTNSYGNPVKSPAYYSNGAPAGSTAECKDGTYSSSEHRSGTCSGHGGVSQWLK